VEEKGKTVKYRLTQDIIHKIFLEEPAVHLAYQNYVPSKMSEQAFWTQYFQSRYIHQGRKSGKGVICFFIVILTVSEKQKKLRRMTFLHLLRRKLNETRIGTRKR